MSASEKLCLMGPPTIGFGYCLVGIGPSMSSARTYDTALPLPSVFVAKIKSVNDCLNMAKTSIPNRQDE